MNRRLKQVESERRVTRRRQASGAGGTIGRISAPLVRQARIRPETHLCAGGCRRHMLDAGAGEAGGETARGAGTDRRRHGAALARMRRLRPIRFRDGRWPLRDFVRMRRRRRAANGARQCAEKQGDTAKAHDDRVCDRTPPHQPTDVIIPPHAPAIPNAKFNYK